MAGPYDLVSGVFSAAVAASTTFNSAAEAKILAATAAASAIVLPDPITLTPPVNMSVSASKATTPFSASTPDAPPEFPTETGSDRSYTPLPYAAPATLDAPVITVKADSVSTDYATQAAAATAEITGVLTTFFSTYFPMSLAGTELTLAQDWVTEVLTTGGAMNPSIENQYWQRDRDRIAREAAVKTDEVLRLWSSRGFPLPPGPAAGAVLAVQRTAQEMSAASSREIAIKKFEIEVMLQQKAVELAINLRREAVDSMIEFIGAMVFTPREASANYTRLRLDATKEANSALGAYFNSVTAANLGITDAKTRLRQASTTEQLALWKKDFDEWIAGNELALKIFQVPADLNLRQTETIAKFGLDIAAKNIDAAIAGAQMAATQSAAALNGIHASATVSGSSSDNTQYYG